MKKLNLKDLKVKSFVTELNTHGKKTVEGGAPNSVNGQCETENCYTYQENDACCSIGANCHSDKWCPPTGPYKCGAD